jgi:hypothetical protein
LIFFCLFTYFLYSQQNDINNHRRPYTTNEISKKSEKKKEKKVDSTLRKSISPPHGSKNRFRCVVCYKDATLWCSQCISCYCGICWNRIDHHKHFHSIPITSIDPSNFPLRQSSSLREYQTQHSTSHPSLSPKKSYSSSTLFASYRSNDELEKAFNELDTMDDPKRGTQHKPAVIPRDENHVLSYQDYPNPPVYLDGKGHIHNMKDHTSRPPSRSLYDRPLSPFHPGGDDKVLIRTLSPPITYDVKVCPANINALKYYEGDQFNGEVQSSYHYITAAEYAKEIVDLTKTAGLPTSSVSAPSTASVTGKGKKTSTLQQPSVTSASGSHGGSLSSSKKQPEMTLAKSIALQQLAGIAPERIPKEEIEKIQRQLDENDEKMKFLKQRGIDTPTKNDVVTVRRDPYKHRKKPKTAFSADGNGTLGIALSSKPSTVVKPMKGITHELLPLDWKDGFFKTDGLTIEEEKKKKNGLKLFPEGTVGHRRSQSPPLSHDHHSVPVLHDIKPREVSMFNGVAVYTVGYKK